MIFIKQLVLVLAFVTSSFVNAAIIDNEADMLGTYKDTVSGLIWMDFGINNNRSYNNVVSNLEAGGDYEGWRLPSATEVYSMWRNVSGFDSGNADKVNIDFWGVGELRGRDVGTINNDPSIANKLDSVFDPVFDIIGYNNIDTNQNTTTVGLFFGEQQQNNLLGYVAATDSFTGYSSSADIIELKVPESDPQLNHFVDNAGVFVSTLLVWDAANVNVLDAKIPEPNIFFIFIFGLFAIIIRVKSLL